MVAAAFIQQFIQQAHHLFVISRQHQFVSIWEWHIVIYFVTNVTNFDQVLGFAGTEAFSGALLMWMRDRAGCKWPCQVSNIISQKVVLGVCFLFLRPAMNLI